MPLEIIHGNVFADVQVPTIIAHGCNTHGVMGAGIALTIKNKFPGAYEAYRKEFDKGIKTWGEDFKLPLGSVIWYNVKPSLKIANCITQGLGGKRPLNYVALVESMLEVIEVAGELYDVRFPFIGGGLGGGNPDFLVDIYSDLFNNVNVVGKLYIYESR
jgi:O-acetyl-ADP-ribose deacetylase (regulator of RNase III)